MDQRRVSFKRANDLAVQFLCYPSGPHLGTRSRLTGDLAQYPSPHPLPTPH